VVAKVIGVVAMGEGIVLEVEVPVEETLWAKVFCSIDEST